MEICFATNNQNKLKEIQKLLPESIRLKSLEDIGCFEELEESKNTIEGNSHQKASYVAEKYGVAVFADDTGLEVAALNGEPGVKSARYAGENRDNEANINLVLEKLKEKSDRSAQFRTVITLIIGGQEHQFEGLVKGEIIKQRLGNQGFGYDPIFIPQGFDCTFAEMSLEEKNKISHRGIATRKLVDHLIKSIG
ncbi:non-canonical purine NTP diphosphatase [Fulvivirga lutea]|uniref:dITP/XTP pyrophosphatase n=1 Tax=Fulvivirga lutea TaxID=2810512 RepID=A0A975A1H2_9BACT|nr:non-canonical purine NTP diphosphatase [Fulvivirga lutea]QSE97527.1 non-canonical purine NTP diphosphatase [Fulvivirga lutea]